jgi:hypothetical protein
MEKIVDDNGKEMSIYSEEQLMARLKFFIGICLALTLVGIVFVVLYSLIFVTQPMNAISPMDQKFFELIIPIATFLTGTLSGIMLAGNDKDLRAKALDAANTRPTVSPPPNTSVGASNASFEFNKSTQPQTMPSASSFGSAPSAFTTPTAQPLMSSTGKPMPIQEDDEER